MRLSRPLAWLLIIVSLPLVTAAACVQAAEPAAPLPTVAVGVDPDCVGPIVAGYTWITLHVEGPADIPSKALISMVAKSTDEKGEFKKVQQKPTTLSLPWCMAIHYRPGVDHITIELTAFYRDKNGKKEIENQEFIEYSCFFRDQAGTKIHTDPSLAYDPVLCATAT